MAYIYCFYFESYPNLFYIGKTINKPNTRFNSHIRGMVQGTHHSYKVQNIYNHHKVLPIFAILEEVDFSLVNSLEIVYIKEFNSYLQGLNCTETEGFNSHSSKYSKIQLLRVFSLLVKGTLGYEDIYIKTGVSIGTIKSIRQGTSHSWLFDKYPAQWAILKNRQHKVIAVTSLVSQNKALPSYISPEGVVYENIQNLKEFVYSINFDNKASAYKMFSAMNTLSNKAKSYKGWKLYKHTHTPS